ncbi:hypothetical protein E6H17_05250 [Candidatus Bathyarchaeota archaeon]|nr:MAG: hypothetical protein E6H17_05250 [Candidatus Bathyarchaeota archaeon]
MSILTSLESQITGAVEKLSESVVSIDSVRVTRDFAYGVVPIEGKGSGLIIDSKGYVITNNHVIDGAAKVQIHLKDGRSFVGEVVGSDPSTDIAVVHVESRTTRPSNRKHTWTPRGTNGVVRRRKRTRQTVAGCRFHL